MNAYNSMQKGLKQFNERSLFVCLVGCDKVKYISVQEQTVLRKKLHKQNTHTHSFKMCEAISAWIEACQVIHRYSSVSLSLLNCKSVLVEMVNRQHSS